MRPHIDFIQAQNLPWQDTDHHGLQGVRTKLLSRDDETGAESLLLSLASGTTQQVGKLDHDLEFLVLDGGMSFAGGGYGPYCYGFFPAGHDMGELASPAGATVLWFAGAPGETPDTPAPPVSLIDISAGKWDGDFDEFNLGSMKDGARMQVLRRDPATGETTYVTATIAFRRGVQAERHPISQEFFMLSGELAGERGIMQGGAYCVRPPMAKHGPYGSPTGALIFFRSLGGVQETFWEDTNPFTFEPAHDPILPEELQDYGAPAPRPTRY